MPETSELRIFEADPKRVVSVTVGELQNLALASTTNPKPSKLTIHERTCHGTEYVSGEPAEYDCDDVTYYCSGCGYGCSVYVQCEDGSAYAEAPRFCPHCGARVGGNE